MPFYPFILPIDDDASSQVKKMAVRTSTKCVVYVLLAVLFAVAIVIQDLSLPSTTEPLTESVHLSRALQGIADREFPRLAMGGYRDASAADKRRICTGVLARALEEASQHNSVVTAELHRTCNALLSAPATALTSPNCSSPPFTASGAPKPLAQVDPVATTAMEGTSMFSSPDNHTDKAIGANFSRCIQERLANSLDRSLPPSDSTEDQRIIFKFVSERRAQISAAVVSCGGFGLFPGAAAAKVASYVQWVRVQLGRSEGTVPILLFRPTIDAGLGNRLQALVSSFLLAIVTDRVLIVDWSTSSDSSRLPSGEMSSMVPLSDLFSTPYPMEFSTDVKEGTALFNSFKSTRRNVVLDGHVNRGISVAGGFYEDVLCENLKASLGEEVIAISSYDWFGPIVANNPHFYEPIVSYFGFNAFPLLFENLLKPHASAQLIIDRYLEIFSKHFVIGVQIRRLRLRAKDEHFVWRSVMALKASAEATQSKPVAFYVATDLTASWERFLAIFESSGPVMSAAIESGYLNRNSKEGLQLGVVDLYLLGECDKVVLSAESTYGGVAMGRTGKGSYRVTKNPSNLDDNNWDSVRLVSEPLGTSPCSFGWQFVKHARCFTNAMLSPEQLNQESDRCRMV